MNIENRLMDEWIVPAIKNLWRHEFGIVVQIVAILEIATSVSPLIASKNFGAAVPEIMFFLGLIAINVLDYFCLD